MRKILLLTLVSLMAIAVSAKAEDNFFYIYLDKGSPKNHFIPSGWMGDYNDLKFNDQAMETPHSGTTCMSIAYSAKKAQGQGWAGIYWQSSENNWGTNDTGYDLSDFNKLVFYARGKEGGEVITIAKVGGIIENPATGEPYPFPDSTNTEYGPIRLTKDWQEYTINLTNKNLSYVNGGLAIIFNAEQAGKEQTVYIDEVYYAQEKGLKAESKTANFPFYVYADSNSLDNHFIPSGWMPATAARDIKIDINNKGTAYSGESCIKIEYKNNSGTRWAGIYWQNPANNWGTVPNAGYNLQGATKLTFWVKGEKGNEVINEFKVGGIAGGEYIDSDSQSIGPIRLTPEWQKYEIDLRGKDLSSIIGGFCWATNIDVNDPEGVTFYLDEIRYEKE